MDSGTAYKLVADWAGAEGERGDGIIQLANGDFFGKVASLGFQFESAAKTLVVRGRVLPDAELEKYPDIMQELGRIARDEPERVSHAQFDLVRAPWELGRNLPTLYLRRDYRDADQGKAALFEEWRKLREMAYLWHRTYYRAAIDPIVERRLNKP